MVYSAPIKSLETKLEVLEKENSELKEQLSWLKKQVFGSKSEKLHTSDREQENLFVTDLSPGEPVKKESITYERNKPKKNPVREEFPEHLERREQIVDLTDEHKLCDCGAKKKFIRYEVTDELEYQPAVCYVNQIKRALYSCKKCPENGVTTAFMPDRPIEKGKPGAGLLSHICISKFVDHLPLYRQQKIFGRMGVYIAKSTMSDWVTKIFELLEPLYAEIKEVV